MNLSLSADTELFDETSAGKYLMLLVISYGCLTRTLFLFLSSHVYAGPVFMFSMGNIPVLYVYDQSIVKEMSMCTSVMGLGKPSYQSREMGPLLGQGVLTSNGIQWAHQRKIIAPELYLDKVKVN